MCFDKERMEDALKSPRKEVPNGLTREEKRLLLSGNITPELFREVLITGAKEILLNENYLCLMECKPVGYTNPFKSGELINPSVDIEESRLRTKGKLINKSLL